MELKSQVNATCRVCATYEENGDLSVKVFGQAEYAKGASATAEVSDVDPELVAQLSAVMQKILKASEAKLGPRLNRALLKSTEIAAQFGEI